MNKPATREELYLLARYELARQRAIEDWNKDSSSSPAERLAYHLGNIPTEVPEDFPLVGAA